MNTTLFGLPSAAAALFDRPKRNAVWLALLCSKPEPIVDQYRDRTRLLSGIGKPAAVVSLPVAPFVGTITWDDVRTVLATSKPRMLGSEGSIAQSIDAYLQLKMSTAITGQPLVQLRLATPRS